MKNSIITTILLALVATTTTAQVLRTDANPNTDAPSLYELTREPADTDRTLLIFDTPQQAKTWTTIIGYTGIAAGAYLGGKAEYYSRYHGTTSDWDAYHITRDAGLICTGFGSASLGASVTIGEKVKPLEIIWKTASGMILYRITAQATYNAYAPNE